MMNIHDQSPLVIGVDIGGTQMRAAVLQGASLHSRISVQTAGQTAPDVMLPRIFAAVDQALSEAQVTIEQVAGIGISTPGPLNNRTGVIYDPPNLPGWKALPLRDLFQQRYARPTYVENDANTAALGEYLFGAGRGCQHMIYLTISTGIGGGVIIDGRIVEGSIGTAGEIGHMSIDWHGPVCACGNRGCLEYLASGTAIARKANEAIAAGQGADLLAFASAMLAQDEPLRVKARTVTRAAEAGIPLARSIIEEAAEALGIGLVNLLHIFNPDLIILGGGVIRYMGDMIMEPALRLVQERAMSAPLQAAQILQAQLGDNAGLIGAGALMHYYEQVHGNN